MAGASRRVSPSGWLWNVCPRSPPRHRVVAAPSLTVVTAAAAAAVLLRKARQGAAAAARIQGLAVVRPCVSLQTLHHRLAPSAASFGGGVDGGEERRGRGRRRGRARPGITATVDAARYFWRQVDIGLTCMRSDYGLPACLPACQPPRSEPKGFSNMPARFSPRPVALQPVARQPSRVPIHLVGSRARVKVKLRDPASSGGSTVSVARSVFQETPPSALFLLSSFTGSRGLRPFADVAL